MLNPLNLTYFMYYITPITNRNHIDDTGGSVVQYQPYC